jgi:tetratricopeptide (TPR) repeat protein
VEVRALVPVRGRFDDLLRAWHERRRALREQDVPRADSAGLRILDLKAELGIENLEDLAAAEVRASARALKGHITGDGVARAEFAVALAPDMAAAHVALARARLVSDPAGGAVTALRDLAAAAGAAARHPQTARAFLGDVLSAALLGTLVAAAVVLGVLFLRRARLALHDFHHLPVVRLATPWQAGFLALALIALPVALRLGPAAVLATLALASALYLSMAERAVATAALVGVALLPWGAHEAARATAWTGTLAEDVYRVEQGADDGRIAARLEARAGRGDLPPAALVALGRHHKRRGDLDAALRWYEAAGSSRPDVLVDVGNVRFLRGDLEGAKAAFLAAVDRAGGDVTALSAAHYGLSKAYLRTSALEQAQEARKRAALEDPALVDRYASDEDFRANRWLIDVPLSRAEIAGLAVDDVPRSVGDALLARLAGPLPFTAWPWAPLAAVLALWVVALLRRRAAPSEACERCGGPACRRCGPVGGALCGQCVNAFVKQGVVDIRDRLRKEAEIRTRARVDRIVARALALVSGGGGHLWRGEPVRGALVVLALAFFAAVAVLWRGVVPPPHPPPWHVEAKLGVTVTLAAVIWAVAVRDLFRRSRR